MAQLNSLMAVAALAMVGLSSALAAPHTTPEAPKDSKARGSNVKPLPKKATDARNQLKQKLLVKPASERKMETQTKRPKTIQLNPPGAGSATRFELVQQGGQVLLRFVPGVAGERFASEQPFAIQLLTRAPLEVQPALVTEANWPKGMNQMVLTLSNAVAGQENLIQASASFAACKPSKKTKMEECRKTRSDHSLKFRP